MEKNGYCVRYIDYNGSTEPTKAKKKKKKKPWQVHTLKTLLKSSHVFNLDYGFKIIKQSCYFTVCDVFDVFHSLTGVCMRLGMMYSVCMNEFFLL